LLSEVVKSGYWYFIICVIEMSRDTIGGFPYEVSRRENETIIRFFPKNPDAEYPNNSVLVLRLDEKDKRKMQIILSEG